MQITISLADLSKLHDRIGALENQLAEREAAIELLRKENAELVDPAAPACAAAFRSSRKR